VAEQIEGLNVLITAEVAGFVGGLQQAIGSVANLRQAILALPGIAFLTEAVRDAAKAETAVAQLDAALKSTTRTISQASVVSGHWATVTKTSGDNVDWEKGMKKRMARWKLTSSTSGGHRPQQIRTEVPSNSHC
jgi:hypothetical protein